MLTLVLVKGAITVYLVVSPEEFPACSRILSSSYWLHALELLRVGSLAWLIHAKVFRVSSVA